MEQQFMKTAFFDFDGVVVDTEPIYDIYWNEAGKRYCDFESPPASHYQRDDIALYIEKHFSNDSKNLRKW